MARVYTFYVEWSSTAGHHGGMANLVRKLKRESANNFKLIHPPNNFEDYRSRIQLLWRLLVIKYTTMGIHPDDSYFFTEFLGSRTGGQVLIAQELCRQGRKNKRIGLVHLPPRALLGLFGEKYIREAISAVDYVIVMGSNLAHFLCSFGAAEKVRQTFYYVDTDYYTPLSKKEPHDYFTVFDGGTLYKNRAMVKEIASMCPNIKFEICSGRENLAPMFDNLPNVSLTGYLSEPEFLTRMQSADASLNVFDDTVGSNTLTISLACGIPQVVSDEGAIRDYCSEGNAIFCRGVDDFVQALRLLSSNRALCRKMGENARNRADDFSLTKSLEWYQAFFSRI